MASRDKADVDMFYKSIQYALEKRGKSKSGFERTVVSKFKRKRRVGSGNELVDYSRAPCLGADQKDVGSGNEIGSTTRCPRSPERRKFSVVSFFSFCSLPLTALCYFSFDSLLWNKVVQATWAFVVSIEAPAPVQSKAWF